jgi:hypothetical protein
VGDPAEAAGAEGDGEATKRSMCDDGERASRPRQAGSRLTNATPEGGDDMRTADVVTVGSPGDAGNADARVAGADPGASGRPSRAARPARKRGLEVPTGAIEHGRDARPVPKRSKRKAAPDESPPATAVKRVSSRGARMADSGQSASGGSDKDSDSAAEPSSSDDDEDEVRRENPGQPVVRRPGRCVRLANVLVCFILLPPAFFECSP